MFLNFSYNYYNDGLVFDMFFLVRFYIIYFGIEDKQHGQFTQSK